MSPTPLPPAPQAQIQADGDEPLEQVTAEAKTSKDSTVDDGSKLAYETLDYETGYGLGITMSNAGRTATSEAPATASLQTRDFDTVFDSTDNDAADLDFGDFDFGVNTTENQNHDFSGSGGGFDLSSFGNQASNNDGDTSSLLQGLDGFADGSGDNFDILDFSNNTTGNKGTVESAGDDIGMSGGDLDMALGLGANNESTFDDLLDGMDFDDGDDNGTGEDMMKHGEFDNAFFGL